MSTSRPQVLLATLLALLSVHGLSPESLDAWRGWITFKEFARQVVEVPDHGVSVQISSPTGSGETRLYLLRQVLASEADRLDPVGGVVCEFVFPRARRPNRDWEAWSFDSSTFKSFVDLVEQHPPFADLLHQRPVITRVYWEDA